MDWHQYHCRICQTHNQAITEAVLQLIEQGDAHLSHYFNGRFENIYLAREQLPLLEVILQTAIVQAAKILQLNMDDVQIGFWFNLMQQGDVTTLHTHDDADELLSGTYYLQVPPYSGDLVLHASSTVHTIKPEEGMFVFFPPELPHEVATHRDPLSRLSLGFNIGRKVIPN